MRTFVITGGTDGIGKALALTYLKRGDEVAIIGRNAEKGAALLDAATEFGAGDRAHFVLADLSSIGETRTAIGAIRAEFPQVDALVLCARFFRSTRSVTAEGFESNLALSYLNRFVLSYEMADLLDAADAPVILNVAGPGSGGEIRWHDLGFAEGYDGTTALMQSGPLNDLLGVGFAANAVPRKISYVLFHPGVVSTGFAGEYDAEMTRQIEALRTTAKPVEQAIVPMLAVLDEPPGEPLSAFLMGERISLDGPGFDPAAAARLYATTTQLLASGFAAAESRDTQEY
ncbi:SDR family NAD(P)-dependent oxidoreductase [Saccharopolyspora sp. K220]|uniref:SDR family NAD(P)-dependent oxidoreductase n=1 Tax=Saccharopolyspora soli TaxID=2926618 RepID=UPI001F588982|nr:SDR family NAD(P)-dependent oxidoreductase [Saccharopolyspora soli]MCI2423142.1 SDR family NAD(P)-dependent oxidoreductase [Saccharopolyspora soli]